MEEVCSRFKNNFSLHVAFFFGSAILFLVMLAFFPLSSVIWEFGVLWSIFLVSRELSCRFCTSAIVAEVEHDKTNHHRT